MKNKYGLFGLKLITALTLSACALIGPQRYLGQELEPADRHSLEAGAGPQEIRTNTYRLNYQHQIDRAKNELQLEGRIQYTLDEDTHPLGAIVNRMLVDTVYVQMLFADSTGKVIAVEAFRLHSNQLLRYPVPFVKKVSLPVGSSLVTFRLTTYFRDGTTMMVSRQINATQTEETGGVEGSVR